MTCTCRAGLAEGALDEVGVTDPAPVLGREPQVHRERGEVVGDARDRREGVATLPLRREVGRLAVGDGDGLLAGSASPTSKRAPKCG